MLSHTPHGIAGSAGTVRTWGLIAGAALIALVGALDDACDLHWPIKLAGQVAAAVIAVKAGAVMTNVTIPFIGSLQFPDAGGPLTVIWLVALMNVVNFSDGVDGLAAGVCTIDGIAFAVIAFSLQGATGAAAVLAAITAGAALGFLFHNFYPAKVFMGDAGANLLGYLLGVVAVIGSLKTNAVVALAGAAADPRRAVPGHRLRRRQAPQVRAGKPWSADADHFHHRMARIGFIAAQDGRVPVHLDGDARAASRSRCGFCRTSAPPRPLPPRVVIAMGAILLLVALAASIYLVFVLEIFKFKGLRTDRATRDSTRRPPRSTHRRDSRAATSRPASSRSWREVVACGSQPRRAEPVHHRRWLGDP